MAERKEHLHAGHRGRMREKFSLYGRDIFHSHELLEMLLFYAVPRSNTNPTAKSLIARFSSLDGVFSASREELMTVEGVGPKVADMIDAVSQISFDSSMAGHKSESCSFDDYRTVGEFFTNYFHGRFSYETVILLLDNKMEYLDCKTVYDIDYGSGGVRAAPFIDAALKARAAVAVIAHNHPYGPAFPTPGDKATNAMVSDALGKAGVLLAEHYVVSGNSYVGFMNNLVAALAQRYEIEKFLKSKNY